MQIITKMKKYYIEVNKVRKRPFDLPDLIKQDVFPNTLIWYEGLSDWAPASQFAELKPVIKQPTDKVKNAFNIMEYKWYMIIGVVLLIIVLAANFSSRSSSKPVETAPSPEVQKEISKQEATAANPADDEVKRVQNQVDQVENNKRYIRNNWTDYFEVSRSGYTAEGLGGISNLEVYFENKTGYLVENVYAVIDIYTANGYIYKTESIYFTNVPAYKTVSYKVPYSNRGTSVGSPRIGGIESSLINFCYPPYNGNKNIDVNDPFRCHQ
jgi:hypothetical protein